MAVVADASSLTLDGLIDAAFAGRTGELEVLLGKAETAGTSAGAILSPLRSDMSRSCTGRGSPSKKALPWE